MHPKTAARRAALRFLVAAENGKIQTFAFPDAPPETRGFAHEIAAGALRQRGRLDWTLAPLLKKPLEKLDAPVRAALRLAGYEKWFLKTPGAVLGQEWAGLMRGEKLSSATGFINAILRHFPAELRTSPAKNRADFLATEFSHPLWLVERYLARLGFDETAALLASNNEIAPLGLRVNTLRASRAEILAALPQARAGKWSPDAILVENGGAPSGWTPWRAGKIIAQDEAAQLVALLAAPAAGALVLDAACAPGGKTTHLAQLMNNQGKIIACDLAPGRLKLVADNARRLGISVVETQSGDFRVLSQNWTQKADLVLLDAPCSGTGTLRRRPDAKWRKTPQQLQELVGLQRELLDAAAPYVKPGGFLVYSTCSLEREENEAQIEGFLVRHAGWQIERAGREFAELTTEAGFLATWPHRHGCDGMFAAKLRKVNP